MSIPFQLKEINRIDTRFHGGYQFSSVEHLVAKAYAE